MGVPGPGLGLWSGAAGHPPTHDLAGEDGEGLVQRLAHLQGDTDLLWPTFDEVRSRFQDPGSRGGPREDLFPAVLGAGGFWCKGHLGLKCKGHLGRECK